jgi:Ca2+-binding RTX toxin-like protein
MTISTVTSTAALTSALKAAKAGDTILLSGGTYTLSAANLTFASDVTVASADASKPAILTGLNISGTTGLTMRDLELRADAVNGSFPFRVSSSADIHFQRLNVHGSLDGNPQNDVSAFLVRDSSDVSFEDSEFQQLWHGVNHLNVDRLTVKGSEFHDLRTDGIRGAGSNWVTITDNVFHSFKPVTGDHADAIQFWTTNTTENVHDIVVTDNLIYRGSGAVMQGVFLGDETPGVFYEKVTISGNLVAGGMYNGINVSSGRGLTITDNVVQGFTDMKSWIRIEKSDGVTLTGNASNVLILTADVLHAVLSGNTLIPLATDSGAAVIAAWTSEHDGDSGADSAAPTGALVLNGTSLADTLTGGGLADTLSGGAGVDLLTGGAGNDLYITDGDAKVVELEGGGIDTVRSKTSFTMQSNIENLEFTGTSGAWASGNSLNNAITGNAGSNNLFGRAGADTISGGGGADSLNGGTGADRLTGGAGVDRFVFVRGDGQDVVTDFGYGGEHDVIDISNYKVAGFTPTLSETAAGVTIRFSNGDQILVSTAKLTNLHATLDGYVF